LKQNKNYVIIIIENMKKGRGNSMRKISLIVDIYYYIRPNGKYAWRLKQLPGAEGEAENGRLVFTGVREYLDNISVGECDYTIGEVHRAEQAEFNALW
jgi:hypothetical protein